MQNRACTRTNSSRGVRWMTEHHAPRRIKISESHPRPFAPRVPSRLPYLLPALSLRLPTLSLRCLVGIKSTTHQPSGYLPSLSVDRPRYRQDSLHFPPALFAFVVDLRALFFRDSTERKKNEAGQGRNFFVNTSEPLAWKDIVWKGRRKASGATRGSRGNRGERIRSTRVCYETRISRCRDPFSRRLAARSASRIQQTI